MLSRYIVTLFLLVTIVFGTKVEVVESFAVESPHRVQQSNHNKHYHLKRHKEKKKVIQKSLTPKKRKRAKVIIIIDDISHRWQLNKIMALPFKVTPSIFPPNKMNMKSPLLAKGLKHFMVHLPLESSSKKMNSMYKTLYTSASQKEIDARLAEIRRLFPKAKYINNHTGSRFTSNYCASKRLFRAVRKYGFNFVDSRTTEHSQIGRIAKEFGAKYMKSDLFIDNKMSVVAIEKEIRKALAIARRKGYVVMIGHPHPETFKALRMSRNFLKRYNVIYIDELK